MEELAKYIYDFSNNNIIANFSFINHVSNMVLDNNQCAIIICNQNINSISWYDINDNSIYVNYKLLLAYYSKKINELSNKYDFDKILLLNTYVYKTIRHEIEHIIQHKKIMNCYFNSENQLLSISNNYEELIKKNFPNEYLKIYKYNPIERQAELSALSDLNILVELFPNNKDLLSIVTNEYNSNLINGYFENKRYCYPLHLFFEDDYKIVLSDFNDKDINLDKKLELGLNINKNEYETIKGGI